MNRAGKTLLGSACLAVALTLSWQSNARADTLIYEFDRYVVRQSTEFTCGPAALSTILQFQFGVEIGEVAIIDAMRGGRSLSAIEAQGGFSLLDIVDFAESHGFHAWGERHLDIDALTARLPAIVPVASSGDTLHFLVILERRADRFAVADPARGGRWVKPDELMVLWSGIALFIR